MKLTKLIIKNFRKLNNVEISFGDASFLIGANNTGKFSVLKAIDILLNLDSKIENLQSKYIDEAGTERIEDEDTIIEGEFHNLPHNILELRGFNKDRIFKGANDDYFFCYRVRIEPNGKQHREIKMREVEIKEEFNELKTPQEYINAGINESYFTDLKLNAKIPKAFQLSNIPEVCDVKDSFAWFENPGGFAQNVLSQLPRYIYIKADVGTEDLDNTKGALQTILKELFTTVRDNSENYRKAQLALDELSKEMDSSDETTEFGRMMGDLNHVVDNVFPEANLEVCTNLSDPDSVLKPTFDIRMHSNITTEIQYQGTGLLRSAVFALLRYLKKRENESQQNRGLVIAFEEPELFLHPNAANNMRNIIYELACDSSQIVASTHSPYMIDLSRVQRQILSNFKINNDLKRYTKVVCFNHSEAFLNILEDDRTRIKMVQKIDDYIARVFFAQRVIVVEGDTEDIVLKRTIELLPETVRKQICDRYQIIKAVGKATIVSFIKYLRAISIDVFVIHDEDSQTTGAKKFNQPILDALGGDNTKRIMMHNCIEEELGYPIPSSDKPFHAYCVVSRWQNWEQVPQRWKNIVRIIFNDLASRF